MSMTRTPSIRSQSFTSRGRWWDDGFTTGELTVIARHRPDYGDDRVTVYREDGKALLHLSGAQATGLGNNIYRALTSARENVRNQEAA